MQVIFEGQALRELVDYRGAHGVRWVMNGVPLGRMWDVNVKDPLGVPVGLAYSKGKKIETWSDISSSVSNLVVPGPIHSFDP